MKCEYQSSELRAKGSLLQFTLAKLFFRFWPATFYEKFTQTQRENNGNSKGFHNFVH